MVPVDRAAMRLHEGGVATLTYRGRDPDDLAKAAARLVDGGAYALVLAFFDAALDAARLAAALARALPEVPVQLGCSTAGEIGPFGYLDGGAVLLFFPADRFQAVAGVAENAAQGGLEKGAALAEELQARLAAMPPPAPAEHPDDAPPSPPWSPLALCFLDGLSNDEEAVLSAFDARLGGMPLVGGSAGDGEAFGQTRILFNGQVHAGAAALCLLRTNLPFRIFKSDHFRPTETHLVVTECDAQARLVGELNGAPAAQEYATVLGLDPDGLDRLSFAAYPVVVKVGSEHFCRSIRRLEPEGLSFFCAVDTGLVLTLAEPLDMAESMSAVLSRCGDDLGGIDFVLGFDCVLRRVEAEQRQFGRRIAEVFERFDVFGFTTYGEQFRAMHLNQTFTGVAFGRPAPASAAVRPLAVAAE
ncbi:FIST N-terminal domain-containing protein [Antarcticirhabdus aurantiaca]|uniref:FIST C-terminal domain-containing protein n=1 Tax=Antarcticirhabdus aurantiaca TaxID=2606717 RepID=A0ACD4NP77_9HYPH|nr:FIST N-terminal domain-containing protein [Antarcticirhabdus aurantiaca]WAJ28516.1 FIST C-terminal domain-containing protein [Jeongeuplla avenae]